jgi:AraC-like DNA-binding protein
VLARSRGPNIWAATAARFKRWLAEHGSSFSEILDVQRSEMVVRMIEDQSRSLPAVTELLCFSARSALARWFRERFGCSITQWRSNAKSRSSLQQAE